MYDKLFARIALPVRPAGVDGADLRLVGDEAEETVAGETPFFGGYAEDLLADLGFDMVDAAEGELPVKARRIQG